MKKIFTLLAGVLLVMGAQAQTLLTFPSGGDGKDITLSDNGFVVRAVSDKPGTIDGNSQYFGTADSYENIETRWKPGGKSSSTIYISVTAPSNGSLYIYVRTAKSSDTDRALVVTQNGDELFNKVIKENEATDYVTATIDDKETKIFPIVTVPVKEGAVNITWTTNGLNFYGFKFISDGTSSDATPTEAKVWDFTTTTAESLGEGWTASTDTEGRYTYGTEIASDTYKDLGEIGFSLGAGISVGRTGGNLAKDAIRVDIGKQIQLNTSNGVYQITNLVKDDEVKIRFKNASKDEERTFTVSNGDVTTLTAPKSTDANAEQEATIKVATNGSLVLTQSKAINIFAIAINTDLPVTDGISTIKAETTTDAPVYNLQGQRVDASYRGVVIQNGKKAIQK